MESRKRARPRHKKKKQQKEINESSTRPSYPRHSLTPQRQDDGTLGDSAVWLSKSASTPSESDHAPAAQLERRQIWSTHNTSKTMRGSPLRPNNTCLPAELNVILTTIDNLVLDPLALPTLEQHADSMRAPAHHNHLPSTDRANGVYAHSLTPSSNGSWTPCSDGTATTHTHGSSTPFTERSASPLAVNEPPAAETESYSLRRDARNEDTVSADVQTTESPNRMTPQDEADCQGSTRTRNGLSCDISDGVVEFDGPPAYESLCGDMTNVLPMEHGAANSLPGTAQQSFGRDHKTASETTALDPSIDRIGQSLSAPSNDTGYLLDRVTEKLPGTMQGQTDTISCDCSPSLHARQHTSIEPGWQMVEIPDVSQDGVPTSQGVENIDANTSQTGSTSTENNRTEEVQDRKRISQSLNMASQSTLDLQLDSVPTTFSIGDIEYVAIAPVARLTLKGNTSRQLLTVIPSVPGPLWRLSDVQHFLIESDYTEDVSGPEFRKFILFCHKSGEKIKLDNMLKDYLRARGIAHAVKRVHMLDGSTTLSAGPHLWQHNNLHQVCRLYDDINSACLLSVLPLRLAHANFQPLRITGIGLRTISIAVPTRQRLSAAQGSSSVIRGKRILVKDIYSMRGLRISACNRAYHQMQEPAGENAPLVQRLIDCGAHIVATGKLSSMISREEPGESLDFQVPFNPRGDGYQSPAGSSSGEAAAIAAYDWLDYAIGSDSTGSGRRPAFFNGCFSLRLSSGPEKYREGMMPCFPMFDAPSLFCRSILGMGEFVQEWCKLPPVIAHPKPTIICLDGYATDTQSQRVLTDDFATDFEKFCSAPVKRISLKTRWRQNPPLAAQGKDLHVYMHGVARTTFFYDFHQCTQDFRREYKERFGHVPPVNAVTRFRWQAAEQEISKEQRKQAGDRLDVYRAWLEQLLFEGADFPVVISPIATAGSNDRDCKPSETYVQDAWDPLLLAPILQAPELTIPIGEVKDYSMITRRDQYLPVALSLFGKPGSDLALIDLAKRMLKHSDRALTVQTGERMFTASSTAPPDVPTK